MKMKNLLPIVFISLPLCAETLPIKIGGFIDTYYAFDTNKPDNHEREFTTQPARHNEFNVNLAFIDATLKQKKTRGRLAIQHGTAVIKNYSGEPTNGATSGPNDSRYLQEAYVGTRINEKTWIDGGIFLGNIGYEGWISKDNWTYTRALSSEYTPYYSSGVRLEHVLNEKQSFQLQLLNGWQNISESNQGKAIGMQYKHQLSDTVIFTYNNFIGDEEVVTSPGNGKFKPRFRIYHNFIFQVTASDKWQYAAVFDVGHQSQQDNEGVDGWFVTNFTVRNVLNEKQSLALRCEYFNDRHEANIVTSTPNGFQVVGASLNFDQKLDDNALWRTEIRGFNSKDKIFPRGYNSKSRNDALIVTSLSIWF
jgi:hypothetical protein